MVLGNRKHLPASFDKLTGPPAPIYEDNVSQNSFYIGRYLQRVTGTCDNAKKCSYRSGLESYIYLNFKIQTTTFFLYKMLKYFI